MKHMLSGRLVRFSLAAAMIALCAVTLFAQSERGLISGTVTDQSGAVVAGAKVTVTENQTNRALTLTTNDTGNFTAPNLAVGSYSVRVEKPGFRPAVINNLTVNASANVSADFT